MSYDKINPDHYKNSACKCEKCGETIEAITVTEQMNFNLGNAVKYVWRAGKKPGSELLEDLKKARWYLDREVKRQEALFAGDIVEEAIEVLCCGKCEEKSGDSDAQRIFREFISGNVLKYRGETDYVKVGEGFSIPLREFDGKCTCVSDGFSSLTMATKPEEMKLYRRLVMYRYLDVGEVIHENDEWHNGNEWVKTKFPGQRVEHGSYRRAYDALPSNLAYRILEEGEVIKEDDQVQFPGTTSWADVGKTFAGFRVQESGRFRRKV